MNRILQELKRRFAGAVRVLRLQKLGGFLRKLLLGLRKIVGKAPEAETPTSSVRDAFSRMSAAAKAPLPPSDIVVLPSRSEAGAVPPSRTKTSRPASGDSDKFISGSFTYGTQTRRYRLFIAARSDEQRLPLVVMLHGCKQDADDFATGTGMNAVAREQGFHVLYPEQSQGANAYRCWNWFSHGHQQRDHGEPALIAALTREMMDSQNIDAERVYIAGLSAGAAMAVIVAAAYPEMFAAVGVHSGLARGAAGNALEAITVMKNGMRNDFLPHAQNRVGQPGIGHITAAAAARAHMVVPTIVFHGDADTTVHPRNGEQVLAAALAAIDDEASNDESHAGGGSKPSAQARATRQAQRHHGESANGQRYTRDVHHDVSGSVIAEHWVLHDAGHAWAGGHSDGSFTDAKGPDASREMSRFFLQRRRRGV